MKCKLCGDRIHKLEISNDIRVFSHKKDDYVDVVICNDCILDVDDYIEHHRVGCL